MGGEFIRGGAHSNLGWWHNGRPGVLNVAARICRQLAGSTAPPNQSMGNNRCIVHLKRS